MIKEVRIAASWCRSQAMPRGAINTSNFTVLMSSQARRDRSAYASLVQEHKAGIKSSGMCTTTIVPVRANKESVSGPPGQIQATLGPLTSQAGRLTR